MEEKWIVIVVLLLIGAALGTVVAADDSEQLFASWIAEQGKVYATKAQRDERFRVFQSNIKYIEQLNSMNKDSHFSLNEFADLSPQEFADSHLMPLSAVPPQSALQMTSELPIRAPDYKLPDMWDWRKYGAVGPVRDQGSVGSCWAFSVVGNIEGQWFLSNHSFVQLSPEQLVDCDYKNCGVFGGWPHLAMEFIIETGGLVSEEEYPYCSGLGKCHPCMANKNKTFCGPGPNYCNRNCTVDPRGKAAATISSWVLIDQDETQIAEQLVERGPLSVLLNAEMLQFYHHGVYNPPNWLCNPKSLNHAVLLVGYGVEKTITGLKPYWLVQNSWGTKFGESGLFRIIRGVGKCGINTFVISAVV